MSAAERLVGLAAAIFLIVACYQVYLFPQRRVAGRERSLMCRFDDWVPFKPGWVWIYVFAYYPFLVSLVMLVPGWKTYVNIVLCFFMMLVAHVSISFIFPVRAPAEWRSYPVQGSWSRGFLRFVQTVDGGGNCFPSMHVAVSVLSALLFVELTDASPLEQVLCWLFPLAISASTVLIKQHYVLDVPAGALLGALGFYAGDYFLGF